MKHSFDHPKHIFKLMAKKIIFTLKKLCCFWNLYETSQLETKKLLDMMDRIFFKILRSKILFIWARWLS